MDGWACIALALVVICPTPSLAGSSSGSPAAGEALFFDRCIGCHTAKRLAGLGDRVRNDMRRVDDQMAGVGLLWDADVADLRAFLKATERSGPGPGRTETQREEDMKR